MLPIFQSEVSELSLLQTRWASELNPVLNNPLVNGRLIKSVVLGTGANVVNHGLGRPLQGWVLTRVRANATVYDTQDSNSTPGLTLKLTASAAATVDLYVF